MVKTIEGGRAGTVNQNHIRFLLMLRETIEVLQGVAVHLDLPGAAKECDAILDEVEAALDAAGESSVQGGK